MPQRGFTAGDRYRYGMNTQEHDDEVAPGIYTAEYWEYDSRLGRRWNLDPKGKIGISDYACFINSPITKSDINGDSPGDPPIGGSITKVFSFHLFLNIGPNGTSHVNLG